MIDYLFNSKHIIERGRYPWVDYARGICILLVVYRHVFEGLGNVGVSSHSYDTLKYLNIFFFSFRMPLFFIVSGMFVAAGIARSGLQGYVRNRTQTIFYPLILWGCIHISLQLLFAGYVNANREPADYFRLLYFPRQIEQFWYLNALFFVSILYAGLKIFTGIKPWQHLLLGVLFYAIGGYCNMHEIQIGFLLDVLFFYIFFAIGDNISAFILNPVNLPKLSSFRTLLLILPFFAVLQYFFADINLNQGYDYYVQFKMPAFFLLTALVGGAFIVVLSLILQKLDVLRFLRVLGYHSLVIFVMHLMVTAATRIIMVRVFHVENIPLLMALGIIMGLLVPVIFYNIMHKAGAWWLFSLKRPKQNPDVKPSMQFGPVWVAPRQTDDADAKDEKVKP